MKARKWSAAVAALAMVVAACGGDDDTAEPADEPAAEEPAEEPAADEPAADEPAADEPAADEPAADEPAADEPMEDVTLRVLVHQNPPMVAFMEQFNEQFEADNPNIDIDMSVVEASDLNTVNQTRLTAGDIDVTTISVGGLSNPVQSYMTGAEPPAWQTLIEAGLLMDLSDAPFIQNYDATAIADGGSFDGGVYAIPLGRVSYSGMFVNLDVLADAGVDVPTTWGELVAACDAVKAAGNECMTAGGADGWPIFVGAYGLLGSLYPDQQALVEGLWTGDMSWDDEQGTTFFERSQIYANEMLEDGATGLAHDAAIIRYAAGDVAFAPTGVWQAPALEGAEPDFDWTYIPFPGSDNAADNQFLFGKYDQSWAVAAETPHPEAAMAYLEAFSQPETYNAFANAVGFLPTQPTAQLDSKLGAAVAPLLENYVVGFEQWWVQPSGAGQWANGANAPQWFYNGDFNDAATAAAQAAADFQAGLG